MQTIVINNLDESVIRQALNREGAKFIHYDITGDIVLSSPLEITSHNTVVDFNHCRLIGSEVRILGASNVVLKNAVISDSSNDGVAVIRSKNITLDHFSIFRAADEGIGIFDSHTVNILNCVLAKGNPSHSAGALSHRNSDEIFFYRTLFFGNDHRNPRHDSEINFSKCQIVNCVIVDALTGVASDQQQKWGLCMLDIVGCTIFNVKKSLFKMDGRSLQQVSLYFSDNNGEWFVTGEDPDPNLVLLRDEPIDRFTSKFADPRELALETVLNTAGALDSETEEIKQFIRDTY